MSLRPKGGVVFFATFGLDGCLPLWVDEWMMEGLSGGSFCGKGKFCGVCNTCSLVASLVKEIVGCLMISLALLILFGLVCSVWPLGRVQNYTKLFCNYSLLMIINNWKALIV